MANKYTEIHYHVCLVKYYYYCFDKLIREMKGAFWIGNGSQLTPTVANILTTCTLPKSSHIYTWTQASRSVLRYETIPNHAWWHHQWGNNYFNRKNEYTAATRKFTIVTNQTIPPLRATMQNKGRDKSHSTYRDVETAVCIMPPPPPAPSALTADDDTCATVLTTPPPVGLGRAATSSMGLRLS